MKNKKLFVPKNKKLLIGLGIFLAFLGVITFSYAFIFTGGTQEFANTFNSGCLNITIDNETNAISLTNAYPITDVEGLSTEGYSFTVKNTCSTSADFIVNLENINRQSNTLSSDYLKVAISGDTFDNIVSILSSNPTTTPSITNAYEAYTLYTGSVAGNTSRIFKIREWIDYDATKEQAASKVITNKINVIARSDLEVTNTPEVKTTLADDTTLKGTITGGASTAKYCTSTSNVCEPNIDTTINSGISVTLDRSHKQIVCSFLEGTESVIPTNKITSFTNIENDTTNPYTYDEASGTYTSTNKTDDSTSTITLSVTNNTKAALCYNISSEANYDKAKIYLDGTLKKTVSGEDSNCVPLGNVSSSNKIKVEYSKDSSQTKENDEVSFYLSEYEIEATNSKIMCSDPIEKIPTTLMAESYVSSSSKSFLGSDKKRSEFESLTTMDSISIPENAIKSWDVSSKKNEEVMAWYTDVDSNGLYELYIGQEEGVIANSNSAYVFDYLTNLTSIDLSHFDTSNVTNMSQMFYEASSLTSLDLSSFDTSNVTDMTYMFEGASSLTSLDLSSFDTSNVTDMGSMFIGTSSLTSLDVSNFDTSKVTNMYAMFSGASKLTSLDLSNFDTSNVKNMIEMFKDTSSLTSLDLSNFDTSNVTSMYAMFSGASSLTSLDVSHFNTSNVTNMTAMFHGASSLTSLDVSNFDTSNVSTMRSMFSGASKLTSLDLSNYDTSNVTDMSGMFSNTKSLTSLDVSNLIHQKLQICMLCLMMPAVSRV